MRDRVLQFNVADYFEHHGYRVKDQEKARVFEAIYAAEHTSRKRLFQELQIRPNSVTEAVQQLVGDRLVVEEEALKNGRKGRPEMLLRVNPQRLTAIGIWTVSQTVAGAIIDLDGTVRRRIVRPLARTAVNEEFVALVTEIIDTLSTDVGAPGELLGVGLSLPGLVKAPETHWAYNSRWLGIRALDLSSVASRLTVPLSLHRMLDAELEYLLSEYPHYRSGSTLLFHWGFGIGGALAIDGRVVHSSVGSFFEVGHIKVRSGCSAQCACGETGCLETVAAVWALLPRLRREFADVSDDEIEFATFCATHAVLDLPVIEDAIVSVAEILDGLYRTLFPSRVVVYGPFVCNDAVAHRLHAEVRQRIPAYARDAFDLSMLHHHTEYGEIKGSTRDFFAHSLRRLLKSD